MNEQELRDKIIGIVSDVSITGVKIREILGGEAVANNIADALIADGIGDVSELQKECKSKEEAYNKCYIEYKYWQDKAKDYKHRAGVAERALKDICKNIRIDSGDKEDEIKANSNVLYKAYLKQAKKELQEELEYGNE